MRSRELRWTAILAILLLALSHYVPITESASEAIRNLPRLRSGVVGPEDVPSWLPPLIGVFVWALCPLLLAFLLAELRTRSRRSYGVLVLVGSAAIAGYFGSKLYMAVTAEQLAGIAGAGLGAIDGWAALRRDVAA